MTEAIMEWKRTLCSDIVMKNGLKVLKIKEYFNCYKCIHVGSKGKNNESVLKIRNCIVTQVQLSLTMAVFSWSTIISFSPSVHACKI